MTPGNKRAYLQSIQRRYHRSSKAKKGIILDEFCAVCGYRRNYAIRLLNEGHKRQKRRPGRPSRYAGDREFLKALTTLWSTADYCCGKLLRSAIPLYVSAYEECYGAFQSEVREKLFTISAATIDRILRPHRARLGSGKGLTKPGSLLRNEIQIRGECWDEQLPGFVEADTVAHCGSSGKGPFISTVTLTDILTQWTESRAVWTKLAERVVEAIQDAERALPFPLLGFDCDNGSEFLNDHLVRYFQNKRITLTRSRPYRKNDNAHVEQKNWMHARLLLGYQRLDNPDLVPVINDLYANEWSQFYNFFKPTMKMKEKFRVGAKWVRKYDEPKTPFQRVLASEHVAEEKKEELNALFRTLNPFRLKDSIRKKQQCIRKMAALSFEQWQLLQLEAFPLEQ